MIQGYRDPHSDAMRLQLSALSADCDSRLAFRWLHDPAEFSALKPEWDELAATQVQTVFLTHDWLECWWDHYGTGVELWVLVARDHNGRLAGVVPLMLRRGPDLVRRLLFVGTGEVTPNHLDVIARPEHRVNLLSGLAKRLFETSSLWDMVDLDKLPEDSDTPSWLASYLGEMGMHPHVEVSARCPYADLPGSFETYLQSRGPNTRQGVRRKRRRLEDECDSLRFTSVETAEQLDRAMSALIQLHQARWTQKGYPGAFAIPRLIEFHRAVALRALRRGSLRFYLLEADSSILAARYCFRVAGTVQEYLTGFDEGWSKYSPGILIAAHSIEQAIIEGAGRFDFLEGGEQYKEAWATGIRNNVSLRAYSQGWRGRVARIRTVGERALHKWGIRYVPLGVRRPLWQAIQRFKVAARIGEQH